MTIQTPDLRAVVERLETVERQNRRMKRAGLIAIGLVGALFVMGQAEPKNRVVEAEQFIVRDSRGQKRALLGLDHPTSPGHSPVRIGLYNEDQSSAVMYLSDGFAGLSVTAGGAEGTAKRAIQLFANPKEGTGLKAGTSVTTTAAELIVDAGGGTSFVLKDKTGKVVFKAP